MVRLDVGGAIPATGLHHIRVEGSLDQEADLLPFLPGLLDNLSCSLLEGTDELLADDLPLALRLGNAFQGGKEVI